MTTMPVSRVAAPKPATPTKPAAKPVTFEPVSLKIDARIEPMPQFEAELSQKLQFTAPAGADVEPSTLRVTAYAQGQPILDRTMTAKVNGEERDAAFAVKDALLGSSFLTDAKAPTSDYPDLNSVRITAFDASGASLAVDMPVDAEPPAGYEAFGEAVLAYNLLTGLDPSDVKLGAEKIAKK